MKNKKYLIIRNDAPYTRKYITDNITDNLLKEYYMGIIEILESTRRGYIKYPAPDIK